MATVQIPFKYTTYKFSYAHQKSNFSETLLELFSTDQYTDLYVVCEGQKIACHRSVLSSVSPLLKALLQDDSCDVLVVPDIKPNALEMVLQYIYTGNLIIDSVAASEFADAINYLGINVIDKDYVANSLLAESNKNIEVTCDQPDVAFNDSTSSSSTAELHSNSADDDTQHDYVSTSNSPTPVKEEQYSPNTPACSVIEVSNVDIDSPANLISLDKNKEFARVVEDDTHSEKDTDYSDNDVPDMTAKCPCSPKYTDKVAIEVHTLLHHYKESKISKMNHHIQKQQEELFSQKRQTKRPRPHKVSKVPSESNVSSQGPVTKIPRVASLKSEASISPPILRPNDDDHKVGITISPGPETPPHLERMSNSDVANNTIVQIQSKKLDLPYKLDEHGRVSRKLVKDQDVLQEMNVTLKDTIDKLLYLFEENN